MKLRNNDSPNHVTIIDGEPVPGGSEILIEDEERALEIATDPALNFSEAGPSDLSKLTRAELDELATAAGIVDPSTFKNKPDLIEALKNQPEANGAGHEEPQQEA